MPNRNCPDINECIKTCLECHSVCLEILTHCLSVGGECASGDHIGMLRDCAQICQTCADFILRGSKRHVDLCRLCADICHQCTQEFERLAISDLTVDYCVTLCRRCAGLCNAAAEAPFLRPEAEKEEVF